MSSPKSMKVEFASASPSPLKPSRATRSTRTRSTFRRSRTTRRRPSRRITLRTLLDALRSRASRARAASRRRFVRVEPLAQRGALHAEGIYEDADGEKSFAVSLGPRFGPVTVQQIDEALHEAPGYDLVVFAGFAATAEAQEYLAPRQARPRSTSRCSRRTQTCWSATC